MMLTIILLLGSLLFTALSTLLVEPLHETCAISDQYVRTENYPCNIRKVAHTELATIFPPLGLVPSLFPEPFIITTNDQYNRDIAMRTKFLSTIIHQFPNDFNVTLSSSNSYSSHRRVVPLTQYLHEIMAYNASYLRKSNETWYLFGETFHPEWIQLLNHFVLPPCTRCTRDLSALSFGIAGFNSGVQWHFHGPGFSEVIHGRKHWLLLPPVFQKEAIPFYDDPIYTSYLWMETIYPNLGAQLKDSMYQCTLYPGEMIYFPDSWHHATINTGPYNVFISTFTTEHNNLT